MRFINAYKSTRVRVYKSRRRGKPKNLALKACPTIRRSHCAIFSFVAVVSCIKFNYLANKKAGIIRAHKESKPNKGQKLAKAL